MTLLKELKKHYAWAQELGIKGEAVCFRTGNDGELKLVYEFPTATYQLWIKYVEIDNQGETEEFCLFDYDVKER